MDKDFNTSPGNTDSGSLSRLVIVLWLGLAIGLISLTLSNFTNIMTAVGVGVLIFLMAFAAGALIGFLFGVPRVLSRDQSAITPKLYNQSSDPRVLGPTRIVSSTESDLSSQIVKTQLLQSNTNLERISDWLTTLLVGAGLVQIYKINDALVEFRDFIGSTAKVFTHKGAPSDAGVLPAIGPIILVFGLVCGFIFMYLSTRLVLIRLFYAIEKLLSGDEKLRGSEERAVRDLFSRTGGKDNFVRRQFTQKRELTVHDAIQLMLDLLYKENPQKVVEIGANISNTIAINIPDYWFYLAAAFAQKLHRLPKEGDEWNSARDNALDCARRAIALDSSYRDRIWEISDPESMDDDFAPLRRDPEFLQLVGRSKL